MPLPPEPFRSLGAKAVTAGMALDDWWCDRGTNAAMRPIKKIAMIGATGMLGIPVAIALMEAGFEVTALARNPESARRCIAGGHRHRAGRRAR